MAVGKERKVIQWNRWGGEGDEGKGKAEQCAFAAVRALMVGGKWIFSVNFINIGNELPKDGQPRLYRIHRKGYPHRHHEEGTLPNPRPRARAF